MAFAPGREFSGRLAVGFPGVRIPDVGNILDRYLSVSVMRSFIASLVLPLLAALSFLQELDHRGGSNNPGGFVLFQGEEFLVAGHEELGLAGFSQREQVAVLGVRRDRAGGQVPAKKREVPKARGEQLGRAGAKSRPEETVGRRRRGVPL